MKKKLVILLCVSCMALTFGCGKSDSLIQDSETASTESSSEEDVVEEDTNASGETVLTSLGEYKGIEYDAPDLTVTDEEVQEQVNVTLDNYTTTEEITDRTTVQNGDIVNINYTGLLDGEAFDGGTDDSSEGTDLEIGSGTFVGTFEEQLIGKEVGQTYRLTDIVFPDDYGVESLAGKSTEFDVVIHSIKKSVTPELTDEFVSENLGYSTVDEYKEAVRKDLEESKASDAESEIEYNILTAVIDNSEFDVDQQEIDDLAQTMIDSYESYAENLGTDLDTLLQYYMGMTEDEFFEQCNTTAEFRIKSTLVVDAVAEAEGIGLSDEDYENEVASLMDQYGYTDEDEFVEAFGEDAIKDQAIYDKAVDFLVENAVEK